MEATMNKIALLVPALALTLAAAAGCDGSSTPTNAGRDGIIRVGFITKFPGDFYDAMVDAVKTYDRENTNVQVIFRHGRDGADDRSQIAFIEDMVDRRVQAIAITPTSPNVVRALDTAERKGIKVVLVDNDLPVWDFKSSVVATDNFAGGKLAGGWLATKIRPGSTVAILQGRLGNPSLNDRVNGFIEGLGGAAPIVAMPATDCDQAQGQKVMQDILARTPTIGAVYGACGPPTTGALQAIRATGRRPGSITVVGFDASPDELTAIASGEQTASIAQFPAKMGSLGIETAVAAVRGATVRKSIDTGTEIVTKDNVAQFR
jgi:simple sugar transport system substrate-binding protein